MPQAASTVGRLPVEGAALGLLYWYQGGRWYQGAVVVRGLALWEHCAEHPFAGVFVLRRIRDC